MAWPPPGLPKLKPEEAGAAPLVVPALGNRDEVCGACVPAGLVPNSEGDVVPLVVEAPTFPKMLPPLVPAFELFWVEPKPLPAVPKRLPPDGALVPGAPKENDMARCVGAIEGVGKLGWKKQNKERSRPAMQGPYILQKMSQSGSRD